MMMAILELRVQIRLRARVKDSGIRLNSLDAVSSRITLFMFQSCHVNSDLSSRFRLWSLESLLMHFPLEIKNYRKAAHNAMQWLKMNTANSLSKRF